MSSRKTRITEATLKGLKPAPSGKRDYVWDTILPGFGIMTMDTGASSYIVYTRFGGSRAPSRRKIGTVGRMGLADARAAAREQLEAAHAGRDPKAEEKAAEIAKRGRETFGQAVEIYIARRVSKTRKAADVTRELRNYLVAKWGTRPLEEITKADVRELVEAIAARGAERQAHNVFSLCRTFFNWAVEVDRLESSPCTGLKARKFIGEKRVRTRVLDDTELTAVWKAAEATPYPFGDFIRLVMLTGARKLEAGDAAWAEFDLDAGIWVVPEARFKSGVAHRVPLSKDAVALLRDLPREGAFVFSFDGKAPLNSHSKLKHRLDALVNKQAGRAVEWKIHDLRRTVRTRLASLGVPDSVAEVIIGHAKRGLDRVYQQYGFETEQRDALERWAARLRSIVTPPSKNVADFEEEKRVRA
jgi:integrase